MSIISTFSHRAPSDDILPEVPRTQEHDSGGEEEDQPPCCLLCWKGSTCM